MLPIAFGRRRDAVGNRYLPAALEETLGEIDIEANGLTGKIFAQMGRIRRIEALRPQHCARQALETLFKALGIGPASGYDSVVWYCSRPSQDPQEHQGALHQPALGAVLTGPVHADGGIDNLF